MARRAARTAAPAPSQVLAIGGGLEGASMTARETASWVPNMRSPDQVINTVKPMADARGRDMVLNDGYALGGMATHKDSIVGSEYRLNAQPNWRVLQQITGSKGYDEVWAEEFQTEVESRFNLLASSPACWLDASRMKTFTGMVRQIVGGFVVAGEGLATGEWVRENDRPLRTAVQIISPDRLSNPNGLSDDRFLRRGVKIDARGRPVGYWIRQGYPTENYDRQAYDWVLVDAAKPWGRVQVIHIIEQVFPSQNRGIADMVAALKHMRMTQQFQEITLQNAVVNASFAAAIESELPTEVVQAMIGNMPNPSSSNPFQAAMGSYLTGLAEYLGGSSNLKIDGVKIPHLYPGTKLNTRTLGTPGGVGTDFEKSLLRHTARSLGLSYEELSADYSNTSYSSARTSMTNTWKFMQSRKAQVADRFASAVYALVLEEEINAGRFTLPRGRNNDDFYLPLAKEAFSSAGWIGASRGQIDELKETQAAVMRIEAGLSTYERECARLGDDFRDIFAQLQREQRTLEKMGVKVRLSSVRPNANGDVNTDPNADPNDAQGQQQ